jgi:hypothetical protein
MKVSLIGTLSLNENQGTFNSQHTRTGRMENWNDGMMENWGKLEREKRGQKQKTESRKHPSGV